MRGIAYWRRGKPANMSDTDLILQLVQEARAEAQANQRSAAEVMSDVRVGLARLQQSTEAQNQTLAEMKVEARVTGERIREIEVQLHKIPSIEDQVRGVRERVDTLSSVGDRRHSELDTRIRTMEGDGRETRVYTGALSAVAGALLRYGLPALLGLAVGIAAMGGGKFG